jgi:hypothetical protein
MTLSRDILPYEEVKKEDLKSQRVVVSAIPLDALKPDEEFFSTEFKYYAGNLGLGSGDIFRKERVARSEETEYGKVLELAGKNEFLVSIDTDLVKSSGGFVRKGVVVDIVAYIKGEYNLPGRTITHLENPNLKGLTVVDVKNKDGGMVTEVQGKDSIPAVVTIVTSDIKTAAELVALNETGKVYLLPTGVNKRN